MAGLTSTDVLRAWEMASGQKSIEQALILLAIGRPDLGREQIVALSIGQRDALLLSLREQTFGPTFEAYAECPRCEERLEFRLDASEIRVPSARVSAEQQRTLRVGAWDLSYRLPNSLDLRAIANCTDPDQARDRLIARCVIEARREESVVDVKGLTEEAISALAAAMVQSDPQAEVLLSLRCPACAHAWQALLEVAEFLWQEVTIEARRLLREVHLLARAYGWREADVLALSPARRQAYLDLVEA
ncbi:MAG TPA: phage baseplate protein [Chloroflexota bacterium]|nr:phage baseplate protein [Chloroflexota bacterium]